MNEAPISVYLEDTAPWYNGKSGIKTVDDKISRFNAYRYSNDKLLNRLNPDLISHCLEYL
jgi:hypothetical protein